MKKFLCFLLIILMFPISVFAGCSLVITDNARALKSVVATAGDISITREELINYYQSYGLQYVNYYNYTVEQAMEETMDAVLKQRLLAKYSKETFGALDLTYQNEVKNQVYDYINESILSIEKTFDDYVADTTEEETADWKLKEDDMFVKQIKKENGVYKKVVAERTLDTEAIGNFVLKINGNADRTNRAYTKYISNLRLNSKYRGDNITDATTLFNNEVDRLYKIYEIEKYGEILKTYYNDNQEIDGNAIIKMYKELVRDSYAKYTVDKTAYDKIMMTQSGETKWNSVYYHPYENQYVLVGHILLKYNDETSADTYKKQYESGQIDSVRYTELLEGLAENVTTFERDNEGNDTTTVLTKAEVKTAIDSAMSAAGSNLVDRAEAFDTLSYLYSQDAVSTSSETYMCINLDSSLDDNSMDAKFLSAVREQLYDDGNGTVGSYTDWVVSSFGVHIIFYGGIIEQGIDDNINTYANLDNTTLEMLDAYRFNAGKDKTLLDTLYAKLTLREYANYETELYKQIKNELKEDNISIIYYRNNYKDML